MLEVRELTKRYGTVPVVHRVSFSLAPCEVTGYLGPNASRKTTTVKMLTELIRPSTQAPNPPRVADYQLTADR
jgi:ABC-2 type transport system ATP-binding protein